MIDTTNAQVAPQVIEQVEEYVAAHWPDLADAEMSVQERKPHQLSNETMSKLNEVSSAYIAREGKDSNSEVREVRPTYVIAPAAPRSANGRTPTSTIAATVPHYTITLRKNVKTESGAWLPRIARLVVDGSGHILRATASKLFLIFDFKLAHRLLRQGALCYCRKPLWQVVNKRVSNVPTT